MADNEPIYDALLGDDYDEVIRLATIERDRIAMERAKEAQRDAVKVEVVITGRNGQTATYSVEARQGMRLSVDPNYAWKNDLSDVFHDTVTPIRTVLTGTHDRSLYFTATEVPR